MPNFEDLTAEQRILDTIHIEHQLCMNAAELLGRALKQLGLDEAVFVNPVLVQGEETDDTGATVAVIELRTGISQQNNPANRNMQTRYVPIARKVGGVAVPVAPFTMGDAQLADSLLDGLKTAKEMEVLPNLSDDLGSIFDPDVELSDITKPD